MAKCKTFLCVSKKYVDNPKTSLLIPYEQGIIYPNGSVSIGIDIWRSLNKHDCVSHPITNYKDIVKAQNDFYLVCRSTNKILK